MIAAAVLAAASAAIFYILIGYPLMLAFPVSVILAVYNGERFLGAKLDSLLALHYPRELLEIIVDSDGSTDRTDEIAASYAGCGVRLLRVPHSGKAAAINAALREASGEIIFFTDVRQPLDPDALSHLVANFADPSVGAVTGELCYLSPKRPGEQAAIDLYWRYELWVRRRHSEIGSIFGVAGCIYAARRALVDPIPVDTLTDDVVIPLGVFFRGYRVVFDPASKAFDYRTAEGGEFRRRLRTLAGVWQVHARTPQLFTRANHMRLHFLSHKSVRLALPWAILAAWAATVALPASSFRDFLLMDELLLVLLPFLDLVLPQNFPLKRITSPAKTFMAMNAATLLAMAVFLIPPSSFWGRTRVEKN